MAYYFCKDYKTAYPPYLAISAGVTHTVPYTELDLTLGYALGLHAGANGLTALRYAPGPIFASVDLTNVNPQSALTGIVFANSRTYIWVADASQVLHEYASWIAAQLVIQENPTPDEVLQEALDAKQDWLDGLMTTTELLYYHQQAIEKAYYRYYAEADYPDSYLTTMQYQEKNWEDGNNYWKALAWSTSPDPVAAARSSSWWAIWGPWKLSTQTLAETKAELNTELETRLATLEP